jgi:hypothetical protein
MPNSAAPLISSPQPLTPCSSPTNNLSDPEHAQQKTERGNFKFRCEKLSPNSPKLREHQENPLKSRRNPSPSTIKKTWKNSKLLDKKIHLSLPLLQLATDH